MAIEAAEMTESEEVASNAGFKRGLAAGSARRSTGGGGGHNVSAPDVSLKDEQAVTWSLLLVLAIVVVWVSPWGKWLEGIVQEITTYHPTSLNFNPLSDVFHSANQPASGGGTPSSGQNNAVVHGFTIPLAGGGSITTNSTSEAGAIENVKSTGNTPA